MQPDQLFSPAEKRVLHAISDALVTISSAIGAIGAAYLLGRGCWAMLTGWLW